MNYQESIAWLTETAAFGIQPGLQRIEALLEGLGHPENAFKSIHVAGTNGKGSVTAMLESVLQQAGISCGRFTSPHLEEYTERVRINGYFAVGFCELSEPSTRSRRKKCRGGR